RRRGAHHLGGQAHSPPLRSPPVSEPRAPELSIDEPAQVREEERIDLGRVELFLRHTLLDATGPVRILQFPKGHSNLTYLIRVGDRGGGFRRPLLGVKVKPAHDLGGEYDILSALKGVYRRAPKPIAFCDDDSLIGAKFYLRERVRGVILRGDKPPAGITFSPELLRKTSTALVDNLAELHAVDATPPPVASIGHPQGYVGRQVSGWTERYYNAKTDEIPGVEAAAVWLSRNMPKESGTTVIHNDYKYDNLILDPIDLTRILAVLDWEMATVGDPLMDLGTTLGYWIEASDPPALRRAATGPTYLPGNLTRGQLVESYATTTP